jgi:phosphoribosylanthranilate isomerase
MWVKICGITSEEDALLAVAMGADAVGFIFAPSPRQMSPSAVHAITRRLPPEILTVGVFRDERPQTVVDVVNRAGLKAAQLHGNESREDCGYVSVRVPIVIKAFAAGDGRLERAAEYGASIILLDAPSPGSGKVFDWRLAEGAPRGHRLVLAGGLDASNVADAIRTIHPWGVDVSTGVETSTGLEPAPDRKDPTKIRAFVQAARAAEPEPYDPGDDSLFDWQEETNL